MNAPHAGSGAGWDPHAVISPWAYSHVRLVLAYSTFQKQSSGILLVFREALIQFVVALLHGSVWTSSTVIKKGKCVCNLSCASESWFSVKLKEWWEITYIWQDEHMWDRFYHLLFRAEVGILNILKWNVTVMTRMSSFLQLQYYHTCDNNFQPEFSKRCSDHLIFKKSENLII